MSGVRFSKWGAAVVSLLALISASAVPAQQEQPAAKPEPPAVKTAEQQFKNIKVLTGLRADQVNLTMHGMSSQLGVPCVHCHTWEKFDLDGKPAKAVARRMITMVQEMNKTYFGGAQVITCYTCHRGNAEPVSTVVLPDTIGLRGLNDPPPPLPVEEVIKRPPAYPSPESILAKYVEALGGEAALRKVTSRVIAAKRDYPFGPGGLAPEVTNVEIYQKAPNLSITVTKNEKVTLSEGFDGQTAWVQGASGAVNNLVQPDQQRTKRSADFYESLDLVKEYSKLRVTGIEKVNGHDAYVILGFPENDTPEKLFFDVKTGLLLRKWATLPTLIADYPYQTDYDDYRKTRSGVMFPFVVRSVPSNPRLEEETNSTLQILEVRENVPIDESKFARPASKVMTAPAR